LHHRQIAVASDGGDLVVGAASLGEHVGGVLAQPMRDVCPLSPAADKAAQMPSAAMCHEPTYAAQQITRLLDHLVGTTAQREGHGDSERLGAQ